jgi:hypothetical protein
MSSAGFLSTSNTEMLWNIIMEDVVTTKFTENMVMEYIRNVFHKNLGPFFEIEGKNTNDLIVLNKKYISWLLGTINAFTRNNNNNTLKSAADNKLITVEDIHKNRQTQFEQDLNVRQQEFTNYMTVKTPEVPKFSIDLSEDVPIKELEQTIKQMAAQRNYDVDMINKNNANPADAQKWLSPTETSIKNEKYTPKPQAVENKVTENKVTENKVTENKVTENKVTENKVTENKVTENKVKYIKIDTINLDSSQHNNIVDLNKHITWKDQLPEDNNIFNKLKKINIKEINELTDINSNHTHDDSQINISVMRNDITNLSSDIHEMKTRINDMNNSIEQILQLLHKNE